MIIKKESGARVITNKETNNNNNNTNNNNLNHNMRVMVILTVIGVIEMVPKDLKVEQKELAIRTKIKTHRLQKFWDWSEYWEEFWRPEGTFYHLDSSETPSV